MATRTIALERHRELRALLAHQLEIGERRDGEAPSQAQSDGERSALKARIDEIDELLREAEAGAGAGGAADHD